MVLCLLLRLLIFSHLSFRKSEEALRGPKADKPANPLPVVTKEPVDLSLDDEPEAKVENNLKETPVDSSPAPAEDAVPQATSEEVPKKLEIPEPPKSSLKDVMSLMLGNQNSGVPGNQTKILIYNRYNNGRICVRYFLFKNLAYCICKETGLFGKFQKGRKIWQKKQQKLNMICSL